MVGHHMYISAKDGSYRCVDSTYLSSPPQVSVKAGARQLANLQPMEGTEQRDHPMQV